MRNTILGIIVGIVLGIMAGATVIAPGLENARTPYLNPSNGLTKASEKTALKPVTKLRIVSLFPATDKLMADIGQHLRNTITESSDGNIHIGLFTPNMLMPAQDTFNAVRSGTVEAALASPNQFNKKSLALQLFSAIPFGPGATELTAWFYHGGGKALFEEQFRRRDVHAILCGILPASGAGWYKFPIHSLDEFKGLKIRSQSLSAHVMEKMGANIQSLDIEHTLSGLKDGQLDGAENALPSMDQGLGFPRFVKNYYFPSWQQPSRVLSLIINAKTWKQLSPQNVLSIEHACQNNVHFSLTLANAVQFKALKGLALSGVRIHQWPQPVLNAFKHNWLRSTRTLSQQDPAFKVIWQSLVKFRQDYSIWQELSHLQNSAE